MKYLITLLFLFVLHLQSIAQVRTFRELDKLQTANPRPVIILIGTDWCKLCKAMEHALLNNKKLSPVVETNYYFLFLNAESKDDIHFNNKLYTFNESGKQAGVHLLAYELGSINETITYPTLILLDKNHQLLLKHNSYLSPAALQILLHKTLQTSSEP